jgi:hypothetical protein
MSATAGSTGIDRSRLPFPCTCNRCSPGRPTNDPTVNPRISADRNPATKPNAITNKSRSGHGSRAGATPEPTADNNRSGVSSPRNGFGDRGAGLGRATAAIGFPANNPSATQNDRNWFHVDHARDTELRACPSANTPNPARNADTDNSATTNPSGGRPNSTATTASTPARSRRYAAVVCGESFLGRRAAKNAAHASDTRTSTGDLVSHRTDKPAPAAGEKPPSGACERGGAIETPPLGAR